MSNFIYEPMTSMSAVREAIRNCEGRHVQQVAYSSFMGTLTQVCFTCQRIRSTIAWQGNKSWSLETVGGIHTPNTIPCTYEARARDGNRAGGGFETWCTTHGWDCPNANGDPK